MYQFIESKEYEKRVDKVKIGDEILEVDDLFDEHKFIICKLKNIQKYLDEGDFDEDVGFWFKGEDNKFPKHITNIFFTKEDVDKYVIGFWVSFYYNDWDLIWSIPFFGVKFQETFIPKVKYKNDNFDIELSTFKEENEVDEGHYSYTIKFTIKNLECVYEYINMYINLIRISFENTIKELSEYNESGKYNTYNIPVDENLKTAIKQYLVYFPEYVKKAKGEKIKFEVTSDNEFLGIHISKDVDSEVISGFLMEYVGFIKKTINNLNPEIRSDLSETDRNLLLIELRSEIRHLQTSLEIKNVEKKLLLKEVQIFKELLSESIKNDSNNSIVVNVSSSSNAISTSNISFNIINELENLQNEFFDIKSIPIYDDAIKHEINNIDNELMKLDENDIENIREKKHILKKIRRVLEKFNDSDSDLNKILKEGKGIAKKIQKLAITYNKFAQWLGISQVPDVFIK